MNSEWLLYDKNLDENSQKEVTSLMRMFLYVIPSIAIVLATVDFVLGYTEIALTTLSVPIFCGLSMVALNRGHINLAMIIIVSMMIISITIICILGARVHEVGIIIFPVIIIFSSLVMNIKGLILTTSVVIVSLGIIVFGEKFGFFTEKSLEEFEWVDLSVALTVIFIHIFITHGFAGITRNNLRRVRDELQMQKEFKNQIAENLSEKTELLRLVHHRVKNNLLLINSLIELETYGKPAVKEELMEITESIHTIARAHDPLYHTDDYKQVAIKPYLEKLITTFIQSNAIKDIHTELENCLIYHEQALLLGIILQKILSSIDGLDQMEIDVRLTTRNGSLQLMVSNKNDHEFELADTSLLQLLSREINGKLNIESGKVIVSFEASAQVLNAQLS